MGISRLKPRYTDSHSLVINTSKNSFKNEYLHQYHANASRSRLFPGKAEQETRPRADLQCASCPRQTPPILHHETRHALRRQPKQTRQQRLLFCTLQVPGTSRSRCCSQVRSAWKPKCEVKPYAGRGTVSNATSGYSTPSQESVMNTEMHQKQREQLLKKCLRLSQKSKRKPTWAEESDEPEAYYDDSDVFSDDEDICVSDESLEETLGAKQVSDFLQSSMVNASKDGKALEFLQAYFEAYETILQQVQEYSPEQLDSLSRKYAAVVQ